MELPADPGRLNLGVYDKMGHNLSTEELSEPFQKVAYATYALSDDGDYTNYSSSPFDIVDYNF